MFFCQNAKVTDVTDVTDSEPVGRRSGCGKAVTLSRAGADGSDGGLSLEQLRSIFIKFAIFGSFNDFGVKNVFTARL